MSIRILLTGSTGFIGRNLKEYLEQNIEYLLFAPAHRELDLQDCASVENFIKKVRPDVVIHAANCNDVTGRFSHYEMLDGNLRMFFNLERCRRHYGKLLYFGSGAEYHRDVMGPMVEEDGFGRSVPVMPYDFSKYVMRKAAQDADNIYDLCLFGVFGKYEEYKRRFISNNICRSLGGLPMTIRRNARFDYLYIDDLCRIMDHFICRTPQHKQYNLCSGRPVELFELAEMINAATGLARAILVGSEGYQREYTGCNSRLLKEIGEFRFTEHQDAICRLTDYYRSHRESWSLEPS